MVISTLASGLKGMRTDIEHSTDFSDSKTC